MPAKKSLRRPEEIQDDINILIPEAARAKAAFNKSDKAVQLLININGRNAREHASRVIKIRELQDELIDALAREA